MPDQHLVAVLRAAVSERSEGLVCSCRFGSNACGVARPGSGVDAAILFEDDPPLTLDGLHLDLADELTGTVGRLADLLISDDRLGELNAYVTDIRGRMTGGARTLSRW